MKMEIREEGLCNLNREIRRGYFILNKIRGGGGLFNLNSELRRK